MEKTLQFVGKLQLSRIAFRKIIRRINSILVGGIFLLATSTPANALLPELPTVTEASSNPKVTAILGVALEAPAEPESGKDLPRTETPESPTPEIKIEIKAAEYIPPKKVVAARVGGLANDFPYGQCTWYVASRRAVSWGGNAGTWYRAAQAAGRPVGQTPTAGAVMVSFEGHAAGHVAYVERVNSDGSFTVSEMNYNGHWGRVTSRTIFPNSYIVGFIY